MRPFLRSRRQRGFTLIELIMVIVIMGVIGGMVAVFMKSPIDAYVASARRAALTDVADTTVRRMARDIRKSLPNSIRTSDDKQCIEFIPTKTGGRYRADETAAGLNFSAADGSFNMLGKNSDFPLSQRIVAGDVIAVYNLGITGADAYSQNNTAKVKAAPSETGDETSITIASTLTNGDMLFPLASDRNRFYVISKDERVVSYVCSSGNLYRTVNQTDFSSSCPATGPIIARNVSCNFDYSGSDLKRNALIRMVLQITESDETVSLQHEVHVNNTP
jgi:MSHA biogenesis protein MshO